METILWLLTTLYVCCAIALAIYASGTLLLLALWVRLRHKTPHTPVFSSADLPPVLVQLPLYNERAVVHRLLDAVAALDYPPDRLTVQILDDSTDDTTERIARWITQYAERDVQFDHIRREDRCDYKAGALRYGLERTDAPLVAIFDADFVPAPDFLQQIVPHFIADPKLGLVQTRWGHLNGRANLLTQAQLLSLDGHFVIEQTARSRANLLMNFSGSGGLWRTACIEDAGGWSFTTLAEDLDLSYRAQFKGWRALYLPDVVVPAEVPPQLAAYRIQQARWAKGSTQTLLLHSSALWRNTNFSLTQKFMGTLHLCQYLTHPLMMILLLLTPPLLVAGMLENLPMAPLGLLSLGAPLLYIASQHHLYADWPRRLLAFPLLLGLGTGLALNNTVAVWSALMKVPNVFHRTPKFRGKSWQHSRYAAPVNWTALSEIVLAVYAGWGASQALQFSPSLVPFLLIYVYAFGMVGIWSLLEGFMVFRERVSRMALPEIPS